MAAPPPLPPLAPGYRVDGSREVSLVTVSLAAASAVSSLLPAAVLSALPAGIFSADAVAVESLGGDTFDAAIRVEQALGSTAVAEVAALLEGSLFVSSLSAQLGSDVQLLAGPAFGSDVIAGPSPPPPLPPPPTPPPDIMPASAIMGGVVCGLLLLTATAGTLFWRIARTKWERAEMAHAAVGDGGGSRGPFTHL